MNTIVIVSIICICICVCVSASYRKNNTCVVADNTKIVPIVPRNWKPFQKQFEENRIVLIEDLFEPTFFNNLIRIENENKRTSNVFNPLRKAGTITSSQMDPAIKDLYYNMSFVEFLRTITNLNLENVSCDDQSNMNILVYNKPGDFISWHFDPNHYIGSRLTVLISLVNESSDRSSLSSSILEYKLKGKSYSIQMKPNSILIFDGSKIKHRATGIQENERRIVLSFTYCDICRETVIGSAIKRCKELVLGY